MLLWLTAVQGVLQESCKWDCRGAKWKGMLLTCCIVLDEGTMSHSRPRWWLQRKCSGFQ